MSGKKSDPPLSGLRGEESPQHRLKEAWREYALALKATWQTRECDCSNVGCRRIRAAQRALIALGEPVPEVRG